MAERALLIIDIQYRALGRMRRGLELERAIKETGVEELVVAGMMTHMRVDASVPRAPDLGYK